MDFLVEHAVACGCQIGEAPLWVPEEGALYWTDTESCSVWRLSLNDGGLIRWRLSLPVTSLMRREKGGFLLVTKVGLAFWDSESNECGLIANPLAGKPHLSFNDGAVDRQGRLLAGTMNHVEYSPPDGCLYRLNTDLTLALAAGGFSVANGIGFSPDGKTVYVSEQFQGRILAFDYEPEGGVLSNRRIFALIPREEGLPDGITVDAQGFVWNAHWGGGRITRYSPRGNREFQIEFPVSVTSCLAFAGENLTDLYVTTGWYGMNPEERRDCPRAGDLFRVRTPFRGLVEPRFAG